MGSRRQHPIGDRAFEDGQCGGGRRLAEDPLETGQAALRVEDRLIVDRRDHPLGLIARVDRTLPGRGVANADRRRDGLGVVDRMPQHERGSSRRLPAEHTREPARSSGAVLLTEAAPVCGDVAGVPDREREDVGRVTELIDDLEGSGLLALDPVRVDAVDERHRMVFAELPDDPECDVESAV